MRTATRSRNFKKAGLFIFVMMMSWLLSAGVASAKIIYVNAATGSDLNDGTLAAPFKTITKGMQAALSGDSVNTQGGTYDSLVNGETFPIQLKQGVVLNGIYATFSTIKGDGRTPVILAAGPSVDSSAVINAFTITGGNANGQDYGTGVVYNAGGGIFCDSGASPTISNNIITANSARQGGGICVDGGSPVIFNNLITHNFGDTGAGAIHCYGPTSRPAITNNTIWANTADQGWAGIQCQNGAVPTVVNCIVWGNYGGYGRDLDASCVASYSDIGAGGTQGAGCISADPKFVGSWSFESEFSLRLSSPCIDAGTNTGAPAQDIRWVLRPLDGNNDGVSVADMGAYEYSYRNPVTLYVNAATGRDTINDGSIAEPYKTITKAMKVALFDVGDTIFVQAGTYDAGNGETFPIRMKPSVKLQGAGASTTTIRGDGAHFVVSVVGGTDNTTGIVIDGFTITGGSATVGGGICLDSGPSPTISNNIITGNSADFGGGILCEGGSANIINNTIINNQGSKAGGAVYTCYGATPIIGNNTITGNSAPKGAGICVDGAPSAPNNGGTPYIINNVITGNDADNGGGIYSYAATPSIFHNTIVGNSAVQLGGGIYCDLSTPAIRSCIVWANGDDLYLVGCTVSFSDIEDGDFGPGNISADPMFVNAANEDYHLLSSSPCIDTAASAGILLKVDKDLNPRPQGAGYDMGAYEHDAVDRTPPTGTISVNSGAAYTTSGTVILTLSAADSESGLYQMRLSNDNSGWSSWETYSATKTGWILSPGDGTKTVYVQYRDNAGNVSTGTISDTIILDTVAPTGTIDITSVLKKTKHTVVNLALNAIDGGSGMGLMRLSNDGGTTWGSWEAYSTTKLAWDTDLLGGDMVKGPLTVCAQYMDNAGNISITYRSRK